MDEKSLIGSARMTIEDSRRVVDGIAEAGINFVAYMPESVFCEATRLMEDDRRFKVISVANENTGIGICAGAWLAGKKPVMMMESPGFLLSTYALARCPLLFGIPILLMVSHRGDTGDSAWWSFYSGEALESTLKALQIPYVKVDDLTHIGKLIVRSQASLDVGENPRALVFTRETFT